MGICFNQLNKVLVASSEIPIKILMGLWRLWIHLCVRGWLIVKLV